MQQIQHTFSSHDFQKSPIKSENQGIEKSVKLKLVKSKL